MTFFSFVLAAILFLYVALAPVFDYVISADFNAVAFGLFFTALGFVLSNYTPGFFGDRPGRGLGR